MNLLSMASGLAQTSSYVRRAGEGMSRSVAVLSSGNRIQQAKDDVSGVSIGTQLSARVTTLRSVRRGLAEASSLLQVADGGLRKIEDALHRMQALAVMAGSGSLSPRERHFLDLEFQQLKQEIERLANETNFNGTYLLNRKDIPYTPPKTTGDPILGTHAYETLKGTDDGEEITAGAGNDRVMAGGGDDIIYSGGLRGGLQGAIYDTAAAISSLVQAQAVITAAGGIPTATFTATALDYPNGPAASATSTVANFLGADAASISNPGLLPIAANTLVFTFDGFIHVGVPGTYSFSVGSDDGFQLLIDGTVVTQFTGIRAFATSTGAITLGAGYHTFSLLYWENAGQEGLLATSSLTAGAPLGPAVLAFDEDGPVDGNDVYNGGDGLDTVVYDGNIADYAITDMGNGIFQITDLRPFSPNGTDIVREIEVARFADGAVALAPDYNVITLIRPIISYIISEEGHKTLDIDLLPVTLDVLFAAPQELTLTSAAKAAHAHEALLAAIDTVISRRAYVGAKQEQSDIISIVTGVHLQHEDASRAAILDADITQASTEYAQQIVKRDVALSLAAQANQLRTDTLTTLLQKSREAT